MANARAAGVLDVVSVRNGDLFETVIPDTTMVTLFLWPEVNLSLRVTTGPWQRLAAAP